MNPLYVCIIMNADTVLEALAKGEKLTEEYAYYIFGLKENFENGIDAYNKLIDNPKFMANAIINKTIKSQYDNLKSIQSKLVIIFEIIGELKEDEDYIEMANDIKKTVIRKATVC